MQLNNKIGLIGAIPSIAMALMGHYALMRQPAAVFNASLPMASLSNFIAARFTDPPTLVYAASERLLLAQSLYQAGTLLCALVFVWAFWLRTDPRRVRSDARNNALLALQLLVVLTGQLEMSYFIALEIGVMLAKRPALRWLAAVVIGCLLVRVPYLGHFGMRQYSNLEGMLANAAMMSIMQVMAFGVGMLIATERSRRLALAAANAELLATQQLLNDMARASERLRMARDLHDTIGHHLTALNLHLDLASHRQDAPDESITIARDLARGLMSEVRTVVSAERQHGSIDLKQALQTLCAGIPAPHATLTYDAAVAIDSPALAHALFSAIQEALTNTVRHARATQVHIAVRRNGTDLVATVTDNGIGKTGGAPADSGNGLRGIFERVTALGGTLGESTPASGGFCLTITLPQRSRP